jgi:hypothetical protein
MLLEHTTVPTTLERELSLIVATNLPGHGGGSEEPSPDDAPDNDDDKDDETKEKS